MKISQQSLETCQPETPTCRREKLLSSYIIWFFGNFVTGLRCEFSVKNKRLKFAKDLMELN